MKVRRRKTDRGHVVDNDDDYECTNRGGGALRGGRI